MLRRGAASFPAFSIACGFALLVAVEPQCGVCSFAYDAPSIPLPTGTASADCAVTFVGPSRSAVFDCPPPSANESKPCTVPAGLDLTSGVRRYSGQLSTNGVTTDGGWLNVQVEDQSASNASTLRDWLGGSDFSLTVACAGTQVTELQDQSIAHTCVGE